MFPIALIGFFVLHNSRAYLGQDKPRGTRAVTWNVAMLVSIGATVASIVYYLASLV
jgi:hypothetical protein